MDADNTIKTYQVDFHAERSFHFASLADQRLGNQRDYHQHGNIFPSQTATMGTLRKLLLCTIGKADPNQRKVPDSPEINKLIGPANWHETKSQSPFGIIHRISPVVLVHKDKELAYCPHQYPNKGPYVRQSLTPTLASHVVSYPLLHETGVPEKVAQQQAHELGTISTKVDTKAAFVRIDNPSIHYAEDELLFSRTRPHLDASRNRQDDQEGYFITERYDFTQPSKTHFRCYLDVAHSDDLPTDLSPHLSGFTMPLGGNDNAFAIKVTLSEMPAYLPPIDKNKEATKATLERSVAILLSPCPLDKNYRQKTLRAAVNPYVHTYAKRAASFAIAEKPCFTKSPPLWANRGSTFWLDKDQSFHSAQLTLAERKLGFGVSVTLITRISASPIESV